MNGFTPEQVTAATPGLFDKMVECGWLKQVAHSKGMASFEFTENGRMAMTLLRRLFHGGNPLSPIEVVAFLCFIGESAEFK